MAMRVGIERPPAQASHEVRLKSRCPILFHLPAPGGKCRTVTFNPVGVKGPRVLSRP